MDNRNIGLTIIDGPTAKGMCSTLAQSLGLHSQKFNLNPFDQARHEGPVCGGLQARSHQFGTGPSSDLLSALLSRL